MARLGAIGLVFVGLLVSCGKKGTEAHEHEIEVFFSHAPDPAVVNTSVSLLFEAEEDGEHVSVDSPECEIEKAGTGEHEEIPLTEEDDEPGHYSGTYVFTEAGDYEVHFNFIHDTESEEQHFDMTVQSP
ncbi:MAG: FixH family protein [Candidatus Neomarinimicrobiota bacterium]